MIRSEFRAVSIAILGRQPSIGAVELECLFGADHIERKNGFALLDIPAEEVPFSRLGGTVKLAKLLTTLPSNDWQTAVEYLCNSLPDHLKHIEGKLTLGISAIGFNVSSQTVLTTALSLKKVAKKYDKAVRIVPNKANEISTAQVIHNKLTSRGGWELILIKDGSQTHLAQSMYVQDINAYSGRDQNRPGRDTVVGMLPPKLAQIILNLALSEQKPESSVVLDPFCGTGVILQEALLMGCKTVGSDIDKRMVNLTKQNLSWLQKDKIMPEYRLEVCDARVGVWDDFTVVASELYLGKPVRGEPSESFLKTQNNEVDKLLADTLKNLYIQMNPKSRLCLAIPAWIVRGKVSRHLPVLDHLEELGYNRVGFKNASNKELVYWREGQYVARELLVLERK